MDDGSPWGEIGHCQDNPWIVFISKLPICQISALCPEFYPQNITYRRDLVIRLLDENRESVMVWKSVKAVGPVLRATGNEVVPDASASYHSRCQPAMVTAAVRYRNDRGKGYRRMIRHNLGIHREIGVVRRPS
jgi:hypothetical protein